MTKSHDPIHDIENHGMIHHPVVVQFTKILYLGDTALIVLEFVLFQANNDRFEHVIDHSDDKVLMVSIQCTYQDGQKVDIAKLDLPGF
jgi:hypothetical protein